MPHQEIISILKINFTDIISLISDPIGLADDLYSLEMLSHTVHEEIVEDKASRKKNASRLMNEVERCSFLASPNDGVSTNRFYKLCGVLVKQANPPLTQLVKNMKSSMCKSTSAQ